MRVFYIAATAILIKNGARVDPDGSLADRDPSPDPGPDRSQHVQGRNKERTKIPDHGRRGDRSGTRR